MKRMEIGNFSKCHSHLKDLACWINFSAENILKCFSYFSLKLGFDISCKLSPIETVCMKCQILFSGPNKKKYKQFVVC